MHKGVYIGSVEIGEHSVLGYAVKYKVVGIRGFAINGCIEYVIINALVYLFANVVILVHNN